MSYQDVRKARMSLLFILFLQINFITSVYYYFLYLEVLRATRMRHLFLFFSVHGIYMCFHTGLNGQCERVPRDGECLKPGNSNLQRIG